MAKAFPKDSVEIDEHRILLAQDFISKCKLAKHNGTHLKAAGKESAFTDNGSIVSFTAKVSQQQSEDTLNSTMFAQLAATKLFNPYTQRTEWFRHFAKVMKIMFWSLETDEFVEYKSPWLSIAINEVSLELLKKKATDSEMIGVMNKTLKVFHQLPDNDPAVNIFYANSTNGTSGNFQLNTATSDPEGNVVMVLGAMNFFSTQSEHRFLFSKYKASSSQLFLAVQKVVLREELYAKIREEIIKSLGKNAQSQVAKILI